MTQIADTMEYRWHQRKSLCSVVFVLDYFPVVSSDRFFIPRWFLPSCSPLAYGNHSFSSSSQACNLGGEHFSGPPYWLFYYSPIHKSRFCGIKNLYNWGDCILEKEFKIRYKGKHKFKMSKTLTNFKIS